LNLNVRDGFWSDSTKLKKNSFDQIFQFLKVNHQSKVVENLKSELRDITEPITALNKKIKEIDGVDSDLVRKTD